MRVLEPSKKALTLQIYAYHRQSVCRWSPPGHAQWWLAPAVCSWRVLWQMPTKRSASVCLNNLSLLPYKFCFSTCHHIAHLKRQRFVLSGARRTRTLSLAAHEPIGSRPPRISQTGSTEALFRQTSTTLARPHPHLGLAAPCFEPLMLDVSHRIQPHTPWIPKQQLLGTPGWARQGHDPCWCGSQGLPRTNDGRDGSTSWALDETSVYCRDRPSRDGG